MADLYLNGPGTTGGLLLFGPHRAAVSVGGALEQPTVRHRSTRAVHLDARRSSRLTSAPLLRAPVAVTARHVGTSRTTTAATPSLAAISTVTTVGVLPAPVSTSHNDDDTVLLLTEG